MPTQADIINRFNAIVMNGLFGPGRGGANWHGGNPPAAGLYNPGDLGSPAENYQSSYPGANNTIMATSVFNIVHEWAMRLTKVRQGRVLMFTGAGTAVNVTASQSSVALRDDLALFFPIPGGQREPGTIISSADLDNFLYALRDNVNNIRNNSVHTFAASCHTSCHGSCHGSRGRR